MSGGDWTVVVVPPESVTMHFSKYYHIVQSKRGWHATPNGFGNAWMYSYGPFASLDSAKKFVDSIGATNPSVAIQFGRWPQ
jgi:hypothetical protein